ncbi:MAG: hypothetical protein AAEJ57_01325, partial [Opitutales bacterium]
MRLPGGIILPLSLAVAWVCGEARLSAAEKGLYAGTAIVDVTPQEWPLTLRGSFFPKPAKSAHDPLHVRALAFENGDGRAIIVIVDLLGISREVLDAAKKRAAEATG